MDQCLHVGDDGWNQFADYVSELDVSSALLVTGRGMYSASGAEAKVDEILGECETERVYDFETNPKVEDVKRVLKSLVSSELPSVIIAVGGGSVIDMAKLLKGFWNSDDPVSAYLRGDEVIQPADVPFIALPSTAGSGSESTHFAVVYDGNEKFSVAERRLLPDAAFVIPSLLRTLPERVAAAGALDALGQGIESYWSIHSTDESREYAEKAIRLAWANMIGSVKEGNAEAMNQMAMASSLAGRAINLTKTTAPHAVSYALSSFFGVLHGHAVGILVPEFLAYNYSVSGADVLDNRGVEWVRERLDSIISLLGFGCVDDAVEGMKERVRDLGLDSDLFALGITSDDDLKLIEENGFNPQRVNNNPRKLTLEGLREILVRMSRDI